MVQGRDCNKEPCRSDRGNASLAPFRPQAALLGGRACHPGLSGKTWTLYRFAGLAKDLEGMRELFAEEIDWLCPEGASCLGPDNAPKEAKHRNSSR
ncbi:hypothetical protein [Phyllobacterium endophyticum]|uniref:Uncharacterized protein n=1 Tax=Phyllobacterium endophyticum TaxID=1149773 RepID=A0A2P7AQP1_9HYPH|nr:hypothetical protein [Phyllobacterium endophyticum]MBB3236976.1 hypothetical protein [Phyllobacterium endophyticum]PSH56552.1 hypothetical protein CU100_14285 [Phyllobacterium endophyticum]TYR44448.1 hypothetical protein FY050_04850 [Phyllobacterium endophyticum]